MRRGCAATREGVHSLALPSQAWESSTAPGCLLLAAWNHVVSPIFVLGCTVRVVLPGWRGPSLCSQCISHPTEFLHTGTSWGPNWGALGCPESFRLEEPFQIPSPPHCAHPHVPQCHVPTALGHLMGTPPITGQPCCASLPFGVLPNTQPDHLLVQLNAITSYPFTAI